MSRDLTKLKDEVAHHEYQAKHAPNRTVKASRYRMAGKYREVVRLLEGKERAIAYRQGSLFEGVS